MGWGLGLSREKNNGKTLKGRMKKPVQSQHWAGIAEVKGLELNVLEDQQLTLG